MSETSRPPAIRRAPHDRPLRRGLPRLPSDDILNTPRRRWAVSRVLDAMTGAVKGEVDGAKKFLGIASPSKLLADTVEVNMGEGVAVGVDKSAGAVQGSLEVWERW